MILLTFSSVFGQSEQIVILETETCNLEGTLLIPEVPEIPPVTLIIAGSGPTDRDGNNPFMKNNSLKMLATGLAQHGIAVLRYDKRGIGKSIVEDFNESNLRFEHYVEDAREWIRFLDADERFGDVFVIGHSEGSLIGMIAAQKASKKFVSIAGVGQSADKIISQQLTAQPPAFLEQAQPILDKLVAGDTVSTVPIFLLSLFRPSVQPYLISWFRYDPQFEIGKLDMPILIIQGTTDIQVTVQDAALLESGNPKAELRIIEGMNHIFKEAEVDRQKNILTYSQPDLPLMPGLVETIVEFLKN
jgi:pimeloyl-ACP methyl ester carboxylesterase